MLTPALVMLCKGLLPSVSSLRLCFLRVFSVFSFVFCLTALNFKLFNDVNSRGSTLVTEACRLASAVKTEENGLRLSQGVLEF